MSDKKLQIAHDPTADAFKHAQFITPSKLDQESVRSQLASLRELFFEKLPIGDQTAEIEEYLLELEEKITRRSHERNKHTQPLSQEPGCEFSEHVGPRSCMDPATIHHFPPRRQSRSEIGPGSALECREDGILQ